jgi:hypothetical protein
MTTTTTTTRPCLVCGVAADGQPIPVTLMIGYGPDDMLTKLVNAEMTRCEACADQLAAARRIVAETPEGRRLAARVGTVLVDRMERTLAGLSVLGVDPGKLSPAALCALTVHEPMSVATGSLPFLRHARPREVAATPFAHLGEADRRRLRAAYADHLHRRDILNEWATGSELLADPADVRACTDHRARPLDPDRSRRYVVGVDGAVSGDRYAVVVCHAEPNADSVPFVVVDRLDVFAGTRARPIDLATVGRHIGELARHYGASVKADPAHIAETVQRLRRAGVAVDAPQRTTESNHAAATNLYRLLRGRRLRLPDDAELSRELLSVRLRESTPGRFKLDATRGQGIGHGDRASALSYAALALVNTEPGRGSIGSPVNAPPVVRTLHDARPALPMRLMLRQASRRQSPAARRLGIGLVIPGSANDPRRVKMPGW